MGQELDHLAWVSGKEFSSHKIFQIFFVVSDHQTSISVLLLPAIGASVMLRDHVIPCHAVRVKSVGFLKERKGNCNGV